MGAARAVGPLRVGGSGRRASTPDHGKLRSRPPHRRAGPGGADSVPRDGGPPRGQQRLPSLSTRACGRRCAHALSPSVLRSHPHIRLPVESADLRHQTPRRHPQGNALPPVDAREGSPSVGCAPQPLHPIVALALRPLARSAATVSSRAITGRISDPTPQPFWHESAAVIEISLNAKFPLVCAVESTRSPR